MPVKPLFTTKDNADSLLLSSIDAVVLVIPLAASQGALFPQPVKGSATSLGSEVLLNVTGASGLGISAGDYIENVTDGSHCYVTAVNTNDFETTALRGGSDNIWQSSDVFGVRRFVATLNSRDSEGAITDFEEVLIENRSGDTLTVATGGRGFNGTTPDTWTPSDFCSLFVTSPIQEGVSDFLFRLDSNKLSTDGLTPLVNDSALTGRNNADSANIEIIKVGTNDIPIFPTLPRLDPGRSISNNQDVIDKQFFDDNAGAPLLSAKAESAAANGELFENTDDGNRFSLKETGGTVRDVVTDVPVGTFAKTLNATANFDEAIVTTATPRVIEIWVTGSLTNSTQNGGAQGIKSQLVYSGSTLIFEDRLLRANNDSANYNSVQIGQKLFTAETTFGTGGGNSHRFDLTIQSLSETGFTIRLACTQDGSPSDSVIRIGYKIIT